MGPFNIAVTALLTEHEALTIDALVDLIDALPRPPRMDWSPRSLARKKQLVDTALQQLRQRGYVESFYTDTRARKLYRLTKARP